MSDSDDAGMATVWVAGALVALLALYTMLIWLGVATTTRHRVAAAADLAALAAASSALDGAQAACGQAEVVAERMDVEVQSCSIEVQDAQVEVATQPPMLPSGFGAVAERARAGPAER